MLNARGLTLIEILAVIVLIGVMAGLAYPRIGKGLTKSNVRSARAAVANMHAKAKATAITQAGRTVLHFRSDAVFITSRDPMSGESVGLGDTVSVYDRYHGTTLTTDRDSLVFDPRGLGTETSSTKIYVRKGAYVDSITITSVGRVLN